MQDAECFMLQLLQCAGVTGILPAAMARFKHSTERPDATRVVPHCVCAPYLNSCLISNELQIYSAAASHKLRRRSWERTLLQKTPPGKKELFSISTHQLNTESWFGTNNNRQDNQRWRQITVCLADPLVQIYIHIHVLSRPRGPQPPGCGSVPVQGRVGCREKKKKKLTNIYSVHFKSDSEGSFT